jgi:hypothetical protein
LSTKWRNVRRILRLISRLERRYHFVSICRATSVFGFYARIHVEMRTTRPAVVVTASNANPEAVALVAAARKYSVISLFSAHASFPPNWVALPFADLVILHGPASLSGNQLPAHSKVVFKGLPGASKHLALEPLHGNQLVVGIFLSAPIDLAGVQATVEALPKVLPVQRIVVRPHPTVMLSPDLNWIRSSSARIELSTNVPLEKSIDGCNLDNSGNSSVHLEVLKQGVPTIHIAGLDQVDDDYLGFVDRKVVFKLDRLEDLNLDSLAAFYSEGWTERFRLFDPSYLEDPGLFNSRLRHQIELLLSQKLATLNHLDSVVQ